MIDQLRIWRGAIVIVVAWFMACSGVSFASETRVALLGADSRFGKAKDLMSAELSKNPNVVLLSRDEWTRLLREYERIRKNDDVQSGPRFPAAAALVIFRDFVFKNEKYTICKLVDAKHAVVLESIAVPKRSVEFKWVEGLAKHFSKSDLEKAAKKLPLYPYAKIVPAKPPGK